MTDSLSDFEMEPFSHDGRTRAVFRKGEGPAVIVMAELPGITPKVADFARRVTGLGCSVWLPSLFGTPGRDPSGGYMMSSAGAACVSSEFKAFAANSSKPVTRWLRALASHAFELCGGPGVGAVGMCFTGGFALGMMVDEHVLAPVLSQPSLPLGFTHKAKSGLGVSSDELECIKTRASDDGVSVMALRFTCDRFTPAERFERLRSELGDRFIGIEIDSSEGNAWDIPRSAHSVLTEDLVDEPGHPTHEALGQVLDFLRARLLPTDHGI